MPHITNMSTERKKRWGYSVPKLLNFRGVGLGNEVLAWAKAYIGAQELGLNALHPAWALNRRGYRHDFGTSVFDWPAHRALQVLPHIEVDANMAAVHFDYADVMADLRERIDQTRGPVTVVHASGMSGGYYGIRRARSYLRAELTRPRHVANDLYKFESRLDPEKLTVALHIRAGDFESTTAGPAPGEFNKMLPVDWYAAVCDSISTHFLNHVQFVIFTDDESNESIVRLSNHLGAVPLPARDKPLLSDLEIMATADLLLCSVSSLSMLAAFLSNKPYIWYGPHLGEKNGLRSIWGHEHGQQEGLTSQNLAKYREDPLITRGTPVMEDGVLPDALLTALEYAVAPKKQQVDLLMYGVVKPSRPYLCN